MIIYISGKMTGLEDDGRPIFFAVEKELKEKGYIVVNPAFLPAEMPYHRCMRIDLAIIPEMDAICMMPNWFASEGAKKEKAYAESKNVPVIYFSDLCPDSKIYFPNGEMEDAV